MLAVNVLFFFIAALTVCQSRVLDTDIAQKSTTGLSSLIRFYISNWNDDTEILTRRSINATNFATEIAFRATDRVTVLVHGHEGSTSANVFLTSLRKSLLEIPRNSYVIEVDWSLLGAFVSSDIELFVALVGESLIELLESASNDFQVNLLHLIGYDVGAHIVGFAGRELKARKITALDPVRGIGLNSKYCLKRNDAQFVEVIHTDAIGVRAIGIGEAIGMVDIYVNGGTNQPGCTTNLCNHQRVIDLFRATVEFKGHLAANGCSVWAEVTGNRCRLTPSLTVGTDSIAYKGGGAPFYRVNTGRNYPYYPL